MISPLAGKPAPKDILVDLQKLGREYYERTPDLANPGQLVSFGTSGHRGSSLRGTFNEAHILAIFAGHLRLPPWAEHQRPAVHGQRHSCAVQPSARDRD